MQEHGLKLDSAPEKIKQLLFDAARCTKRHAKIQVNYQPDFYLLGHGMNESFIKMYIFLSYNSSSLCTFVHPSL